MKLRITKATADAVAFVFLDVIYYFYMSVIPSNILNAIPFFGIAIVFLALVYWVPTFFIIYHLTRFGIGSRPKFLALVFLVGSVILFSLFIIRASQLDLTVLVQQVGNYIKN